eukprot:5000905-Prymnesium_polylepis.1
MRGWVGRPPTNHPSVRPSVSVCLTDWLSAIESVEYPSAALGLSLFPDKPPDIHLVACWPIQPFREISRHFWLTVWARLARLACPAEFCAPTLSRAIG